MKLTIKYENREPLISDSRDENSTVPIKQGRRAYKLAKEATKVLEKMGKDFSIPDDILYAPFEFDFSGALPRYFGLNEKGIDRIRLPFYAGKYAARHEGGHMAHRRAIEASGVEINLSERQLEKIAKKDLMFCEAFADRYAGQNRALVSYGGTAAALGVATVARAIDTPETLLWMAPLTAYVTYTATRIANHLKRKSLTPSASRF